MTGLGQHAEQLLRMTADIVLNSTFPDVELKRELEVICQEAIEYEEDPEEAASDLLERAIWDDDPVGMPVIGTVENIDGFTRDDLVRHVRAHHRPDSIVVAVAGQVDVDAWLTLAQALFAPMPAAANASAPRPKAAARYVGQAMANASRRCRKCSSTWPFR